MRPIVPADAASATLTVVKRWLNAGPAPKWRLSAGWYLRGLSIIYLIAFISLGVQVKGLVGSEGIQPVRLYLADIREQVGYTPWWQAPTLCWIDSSDRSLTIQCAAGVVLSLIATAEIAQPVAFALLWLFYLSLTVASQEFLGYQWDNLLLEAGLLAIFLAPLRLIAPKPGCTDPSPVMIWLQRWLIFRLMFLSGLVKLSSGDATWRNGTAMLFHYWTQPIPTWTSWYASHLPLWFAKLSVTGVFVLELALPFLMFGPRRLRMIAASSTVFLQILILATGNYGFFNLLAIVLCIPLLDDDVLMRCAIGRSVSSAPPPRSIRWLGPLASDRHWSVWVTGPLAGIVLIVSLMRLVQEADYQSSFPAPLQAISEAVSPLRSINGYGLFASMTTSRPELIFEGSDDGKSWKEYQFRWKAGNVHRRPTFCTPHLPRLDWQLWFAALSPRDNKSVLQGFISALLRGSKPALGLLGDNPFPDRPPRYVRIHLYDYRFTTPAERAKTGAWWHRNDSKRISQVYSVETNER